MQTLNKSLVKNTFTYTWFIYPVSAILLTLIWLWSFPTFHQPSAHQKIDAFFATDVKSTKFADQIKEKYEPKQLREVNISYALPANVAVYTEKLKIAITNSDFLVLPKAQFKSYGVSYPTFFAPITSYIQEKCGVDETSIIDGYGIEIKIQGEAHYLEQYMTFEEKDYVLAFSVSSKNLGEDGGKDNAEFDNALTFVHYLIEGQQ